MAKYLFSRLILVFFISFFTSWAFNTYNQLEYFFDIEPTGFFFGGLDWLLTVIIIVFGVVIINAFFLLLDFDYSSEIIQGIKKGRIIQAFKDYLSEFFRILKDNFNYELQYDLYPKQFLVFAIIFLLFIKGNPLINNYHGIAKEYYIGGQGMYANEARIAESQDYILHNSDIALIKQRMVELERELSDDEPFFKVKERGYIFIQSGLVEGYQSPSYEYTGFISYFGSLFYLAIEKFINVILYFLIPFSISIGVYHFYHRRKQKKVQNKFY